MVEPHEQGDLVTSPKIPEVAAQVRKAPGIPAYISQGVEYQSRGVYDITL